VGWRADVHARVTQDEIFEVNNLAVEPERGAGVGEILAGAKTLKDGAGSQALIETGQRIVSAGEGTGNFGPGQRIRIGPDARRRRRRWILDRQGIDNLQETWRNGLYHGV
jgi:hypothetical protein